MVVPAFSGSLSAVDFAFLASFLLDELSSLTSSMKSAESCLIPRDILSLSTSIASIFASTSSPFLYFLTASSFDSGADISERWISPSIPPSKDTKGS